MNKGEREFHPTTSVNQNKEQNEIYSQKYIQSYDWNIFNHNWIYDEQIILKSLVTTELMFCFILFYFLSW